MRRVMKTATFLAAATLLATGVTLPAQALQPVPIPGTSSSLFAWSNYESTDEADALSAVEYMSCPTRMAKPTASTTEKAAIDRARAAVVEIEGAKDITAISRVMKKRTLQAHRDVMLALSLGGKLGGAAAMSLLLAQKSNERQHLVNAAALMLQFGRPEIAYDLLVWADKRTPGADADGTGRAAYESAWGEIQLRLGDYEAAQQRFEAANAAYGLSMSPRIGVARALACAGKMDEAARWWARGQRALDLPDPFDETSDEPVEPQTARVLQPRWKVILVQPLIDPNQGIGGAKFASWDPPQNANVPDDYWMSAYQFASAALDNLDSYFAKSTRMTWIQRAIERYAGRLLKEDRSVRITEDMIDVQLRNLIAAADPEDELGCGAADNFGSYWAAARRLYELHQDLADRWHQIYTAAAKQTESKAVNKFFNEMADEYVYRAYVDFTQLIGGAAQLGGDNIAGHASFDAMKVRANDEARLDGQEVPYPNCRSSFNNFATAKIAFPAAPGDPGSLGPCNAVTKGYGFSLSTEAKLLKKLPVSLEVKAKCDTTSVEIKGPPIGFPLASLTGFLSYEDNFSDNKVEIFGGVKGTYGLEGAKADVNVGIAFVYGMGEDGPEIIDVRLKSETAISASDGPNSYEVKESLSVSFVTGAVGE